MDFLFIVTPIVGVCNCSMFCCTLLYVHSSIAIILMGKRELIALLNLSSWCLVMVGQLFLAVPRGCLQFVIVVFPDHTHLLFFNRIKGKLYGCSFWYWIPCNIPGMESNTEFVPHVGLSISATVISSSVSKRKLDTLKPDLIPSCIDTDKNSVSSNLFLEIPCIRSN